MVSWSDFRSAAAILQQGGLVGMPTETVYGLAADIANPAGIQKIFELKKRPFFDPLIVHVSKVEQVHQVVREWPPIAAELAERLWPGPLTLVLPKRHNLNSMITSWLDTVGVRLPQHPFARRLISSVGSPLAAPSANLFGKTSPTTAQHVRDEFGDDLLVIDGGPCDIGLESTVLLITAERSCDRLTILRPGMITEDRLAEIFSQRERPVIVDRDSSNASPGHLTTHYQPKIPLVIIGERDDVSNPHLLALIQQRLKFPVERFQELILRESPFLAARSLYATLRELSESGADFLCVRRLSVASSGEWEAVWDRIQRAASADLSTR